MPDPRHSHFITADKHYTWIAGAIVAVEFCNPVLGSYDGSWKKTDELPSNSFEVSKVGCSSGPIIIQYSLVSSTIMFRSEVLDFSQQDFPCVVAGPSKIRSLVEFAVASLKDSSYCLWLPLLCLLLAPVLLYILLPSSSSGPPSSPPLPPPTGHPAPRPSSRDEREKFAGDDWICCFCCLFLFVLLLSAIFRILSRFLFSSRTAFPLFAAPYAL